MKDLQAVNKCQSKSSVSFGEGGGIVCVVCPRERVRVRLKDDDADWNNGDVEGKRRRHISPYASSRMVWVGRRSLVDNNRSTSLWRDADE